MYFLIILLSTFYFLFFVSAHTHIHAQIIPVDTDDTFPSTSIEDNLADSLRRLIDNKSIQLQELQKQREEIEKNLDEVGKSKNSLKKELQTINYTINQLNLSVKANKLSLEQLELEIDALHVAIKNIQMSIKNKQETVAKLFVELQQRDRDNLFTTLLKHRNLSQGVARTESFATLNQALIHNVQELRDLQFERSRTLTEEQEKKRRREQEQINLANRRYIIQDQKGEKQRLLTQTKNQEEVYQEELQELLEKQTAIADEIEKIEFELRSKIDPTLLPLPRGGVLGIPVASNMHLSQGYGKTKFARYGYRGKFHNGVDFAAPVGTPIFASEAGIVDVVDDQDRYKGCYRGAYGKYIVIKHDNNLVTLYAHLSRFLVKKGDRVERGELIGYIGRTGYATGPHLHFTVYAGPTYYLGTSRTCGLMPFGGDLNPTKYLEL